MRAVLGWRTWTLGCANLCAHDELLAGQFKAGCAALDISPRVPPAIRNGGFDLERT